SSSATDPSRATTSPGGSMRCVLGTAPSLSAGADTSVPAYVPDREGDDDGEVLVAAVVRLVGACAGHQREAGRNLGGVRLRRGGEGSQGLEPAGPALEGPTEPAPPPPDAFARRSREEARERPQRLGPRVHVRRDQHASAGVTDPRPAFPPAGGLVVG